MAPEPPALREQLAGYALALYLISGSWSLARVSGVEAALIWEPRTWAVAALLALAFAPGRRARRETQPPSVLGAELAWMAMSLAAMAWSPDLELAGVDGVELGLMMVAAISLHRLGRGGHVQALAAGLRRGLLLVLFALASLALVAGLGGGRLAVLGGGPNIFGRNMGILAALALEQAMFGVAGPNHSARRPGGTLTQLGWSLVATAAVGLVVLSGSRGAMIATATGVGALLLLGRGRLGRRLLVMLSVGSLGVGLVLFTPLGAKVVESFADRVLDLLLVDGYVSSRDLIYQIALERGAEAPFFGHGLASFAAYTPWPYAHNIVLDAWFETGALGVALLGLYLGRSSLALWRLGTSGREVWAAIALLILMASQFSGGRYDARGLFVFMSLCLALPVVSGDARRGRP